MVRNFNYVVIARSVTPVILVLLVMNKRVDILLHHIHNKSWQNFPPGSKVLKGADTQKLGRHLKVVNKERALNDITDRSKAGSVYLEHDETAHAYERDINKDTCYSERNTGAIIVMQVTLDSCAPSACSGPMMRNRARLHVLCPTPLD
jgi:hypothetical protein